MLYIAQKHRNLFNKNKLSIASEKYFCFDLFDKNRYQTFCINVACCINFILCRIIMLEATEVSL